jgi:hypothetical protein
MSAAELSPAEYVEVRRFGLDSTVKLRTSPVQQRSLDRLAAITAAAHQALAENGRDRFTTQQVAEISGCSIGTIYRYFDDRVAILDAIFPDRDQSLPVRPVAPEVAA